jgi:hypothetical protein
MAAVVPQTDANTEQATPDTGTPGGVEEPRRTFRWYLACMLALALMIFAASGVVNFRLNPLVYDASAIRAVAATLTEGGNYANYDPNINWRALRREQIRQWTSTPDVIVFGGSRWWEAHGDLFPGKTFANLWVSNDQAEDALALTELLEQAHRLPRTLILSLRFISFQPPAEREATEWQEWAPEYRAMAERIGVTPHSYVTTAPVKKWSAMFYAPGAYDRALQVSRVADRPGATEATQLPKLDVIASDGSIYWSAASKAKFTVPLINAAVTKELRRIGNTAPNIDQTLVEAFGKIVRYLTAKGVQVVLAQTPYHPTFWNTVKQRPFGVTLTRLEAIARDIAARDGVISVGGYDPEPLGCVAAEFIDHIHANPTCVSKVLKLVPGLMTGA